MPAAERALAGRAGPSPLIRVLLVEDDDGDAFLVEELLRDAEDQFELVRARTLGEALELVFGDVDCVLLDLGLPDAQGSDALRRLVTAAGSVPVVVLTGLMDRTDGPVAVANGAQDYLVKGEVTGIDLGHALRFALERGQAVEAGRRSLLAQQRELENEHLARGLLPRPLVADPGIQVATRYRPGGPEALLGGDFFDAVERPDGSIRLLIGDVCGHGPDEAALGVALRISWRALVLAGQPAPAVLAALDEVFAAEPHGNALFATIADAELSPDRRRLRLHLCGHPPPLLVHPEVRWLSAKPRPPVGLGLGLPFEATDIDLPEDAAMVLLTDGVFEGRSAEGDRFGVERLLAATEQICLEQNPPGVLLDRMIEEARRAHGGDLPDDVALLWVGPRLVDG